MPIVRSFGHACLARLACLATTIGLGLGLATGCNKGPKRLSDRYDRQAVETSLAKAADPEQTNTLGLVLGEFPLASKAIIDGDTIKVLGLSTSLRLLALDTEETFKTNKDTALFDRLGFEGYLAAVQAKTHRPVKAASPLGMDAKKFASAFFKGVKTVRLERDHVKELRGAYDRLLTYVFAKKDGQWVNYNLECVRAGMSPYFTKYGYSRRFHDEFVAAQNEARAAKIGIWEPGADHYHDYDVRLAWWEKRAQFLHRFEQDAKGRDDMVVLTHWDAMERLKALEGKRVEVLAGVGDLHPAQGKRPARVLLSRKRSESLPLIFFNDKVLTSSGIAAARGEFVRVRGVVKSYRPKARRRRDKPREQLQIIVQRSTQIVTSQSAPPNPNLATQEPSP